MADTSTLDGKVVDELDSNKAKEESGIIEHAKKYIDLISLYPTMSSYEEKEKAKKALVKIYKKGNVKVKTTIVFWIGERLSNVREMRNFVKAEDYKGSSPQEMGRKLAIKIFNYEGSLDGIVEFISLLSEMDDSFSLKMLLYHLSRYLSMPPSYASSLLVYKCLEGLKKSKQLYAVDALINIFSLDGNYSSLIAEALASWYEKIDKLKVSSKVKKEIKNKINNLIEFDNNPTYFR